MDTEVPEAPPSPMEVPVVPLLLSTKVHQLLGLADLQEEGIPVAPALQVSFSSLSEVRSTTMVSSANLKMVVDKLCVSTAPEHILVLQGCHRLVSSSGRSFLFKFLFRGRSRLQASGLLWGN